MAYHAEPDDEGLAYQSTHPGFNWYSGCTQLGERDDVGYLITDPAVVPTEDWPNRLYANIAHIFMVIRVREIDDACLSRIKLLQFHCDCVLRSGCIWYRSNAYIRRLR